MTKLSVNVNKIATLRNTRSIGIPSILRCARICLDAGAHGITVHPRPDERHIRPRDVYDLSAMVAGRRGAEFNIEGNPFHKYMEFARDLKPTQATLVPDETSASTSDHGWDLARDGERLGPIIEELQRVGVKRVSLFMDPVTEEMAIAKAIGADRVELYTAPFAEAFGTAQIHAVAGQYANAARAAAALGLGVNAGHDLNLDNLPLLLEYCPQIAEVSIGHALIADALENGLAATVKAYLAATEQYPTDA
ncbi:pyridoxine 5'-phosphate synthase [soil metagenome]